MLKFLPKSAMRLDCIHVVPGDARNHLVEEIVDSNLIKYGVLAIYRADLSMRDKCLDLSIPFHTLGFTKKNLFFQFFALLIFVLKTRPRSLFLHSFYPSLLGAGLVFLCPFTKIISVRHHNAVHLLSNNRKGIILDRLIARVSFRTIAVSNAVKNTMIRQGCKKDKIVVIYNGISLRKSKLDRNSPHIESSSLNLLAAGRLDWQKNYETMLQIALELKNKGVDFNLSILGTGNEIYSTSLFEKTRLLGITDCVKWEGWQPDIEYWFKKSDIFLHTAVDEACPLVLIEALLSGLPVIASDAGGSAEVIKDFASSCGVNDINTYVDQIILTWENFTQVKLKAQNQIPSVEKKFGSLRMKRDYEVLTLSFLNWA
jgi:glycosyltransferase involved in cell wall biosynthesis